MAAACSQLDRLDTLIGRFASLFGGFISLLDRLGNFDYRKKNISGLPVTTGPRGRTATGFSQYFPLSREAAGLSPFELGDEKDLGAWAERLEVGGLVEGTVDCDGGFFFEMLPQAGVELVHRLDDTAQVLGFDLEFAHPAGVPPAEAGGKHDACPVRGHR